MVTMLQSFFFFFLKRRGLPQVQGLRVGEALVSAELVVRPVAQPHLSAGLVHRFTEEEEEEEECGFS